MMGPCWHELQGAAAKPEVGVIYCGIICDAIGGHTEHGGGQAVAASGAANVGAGGQHTAGAGGQVGVDRLNQLQGQQGHRLNEGQHEAQPLIVAGMVATASKASIFFNILCLLRKQSQITAWVESSECPIQTLIGRVFSRQSFGSYRLVESAG